MAEFDFSELMKLAADLGEAEVKIVPFARKAVEFTANQVKKDWKPEAKVSGAAATYASSIDYEMILNRDGIIGAEIGPNLANPGGGWGLLEDGNEHADVLSAPQHAGRKAAKKNEADFVKGLLQAGEDALR